jgi:MFS family permease
VLPNVRQSEEGTGRKNALAEAAFSDTESALENQRIGALQIGVVAICTLIQMCDGYDVGSIGWAVPSLTQVWNLPPPAFATAFVWSSVGVMVGALTAGPIGDRVGRKPLLLASVTIFGIASLLNAVAPSLAMLSLWRFFTGLGIGGACSGTVALTGDYTPQRLRATMIMVQFTGAPLGGFVGGLAVAALLARFGWEIIFVIGGVFPLALLPVMALCVSSLASRICRRVSRRCSRASTSSRGRRIRILSTLLSKTRSRCSLVAATRCRPCCCGSSTFAACSTCSCLSTGCLRSCT